MAHRRADKAYRASDWRDVRSLLLDRSIRYTIAALLTAAAGAVYELFSHGVYSYYMIYAFVIPLAGGTLPSLLAARASVRGGRAFAEAGEGAPGDGLQLAATGALSGGSQLAATGALSSGLQLAAIATLTAGCFMKGILEIYGTTNRLMIVYAVLGLMLLAAAVITNIAELRRH